MSEEDFNPSEPGISHPLTRCGFRLTDDGRLLLQAGDSAGIIIDEKTGVVCVYGTEIRFISAKDVTVNGKKIVAAAPDISATSAGSQLRNFSKAGS